MVIVGILSYLKAGRAGDADKLLNLAKKRLNTSEWPYSIIAYLRNEVSQEALLSLATDNNKLTEARTYIGLSLSIAGQQQEALKHLNWVKENGNKQFVEYPAAVMELLRLEQHNMDNVRRRQ